MTDARSALKRWQEAQPAPVPVRNPDSAVRATRVTPAGLSKLRAVADSDVAPAELLNQKMHPDALFGTLYSALTAYEFMKLQAEYRRRRASGRGLAGVEQQWQQILGAARTAYTAAGLRGLQVSDLDRFVQELSANRSNLNTVVRLANSAVAVGGAGTLTARTAMVASFVPVVEKYIDPSIVTTTITDLCDEPIAEGSFTKHFSRSISLTVKIKYWCPTWRNPFRTCTKTITLAGVSFSIGVDVGYRINCCGATAWGQAYSQVCATIVGISVCASCSATVTGVAGVSRTPVGSGCSYGVGINAVLQCKVAGYTILYVSIPFGWVVNGPCPPPGLCP